MCYIFTHFNGFTFDFEKLFSSLQNFFDRKCDEIPSKSYSKKCEIF